MSARREIFSRKNDLEGYLILLCDYQVWGSQQEFQAFAELYIVNINVYDKMICSNPMYHISSRISTNQTISHYDSFWPRYTKEVLKLCSRKCFFLSEGKRVFRESRGEVN